MHSALLVYVSVGKSEGRERIKELQVSARFTHRVYCQGQSCGTHGSWFGTPEAVT